MGALLDLLTPLPILRAVLRAPSVQDDEKNPLLALTPIVGALSPARSAMRNVGLVLPPQPKLLREGLPEFGVAGLPPLPRCTSSHWSPSRTTSTCSRAAA